MSNTVSDVSGNRNDKIANAAKVLGKSPQRILLFLKVYSGKKTKNVFELISLTGLSQVRVLQLAKNLSSEDIIKEIKVRGSITQYQKIDFYTSNRDRIVKLARSRKALERFPTKLTPSVIIKGPKTDKSRTNQKVFDVQEITIDDIDSFRKVRMCKSSQIDISSLSETDFKNGVKRIIGEAGVFKDWGGEINDLFTTRVLFKGRRIRTAFAFKGPGKKGKLTPGMMGKNGDQIPRLFISSASLFILQYWDQIENSVVELMKLYASRNSHSDGGNKVFYCLIDGADTRRIVASYITSFPSLK